MYVLAYSHLTNSFFIFEDWEWMTHDLFCPMDKEQTEIMEGTYEECERVEKMLLKKMKRK